MASPFDREPPSGPLSERPRSLTPPSDPLAGEDAEGPVWPLGDKTVRGRLLSSFSSAWLLHQRNDLVVRCAKRPDGWLELLIEQIDAELTSRGGE